MKFSSDNNRIMLASVQSQSNEARQHPESLFRVLLLSTAITVCLLLSGCDADKPHPAIDQGRTDEQVFKEGTVKVLTLNSPTTYFVNRENAETGPEFDLLSAFGKTSNLKISIEVADSVSDLLSKLDTGQYDMAAANLTATKRRAERYRFGPAYQDVTQQVVCRRHGKQATSLEALAKINLSVVSHSSYEETLQTLKLTHEDLNWQSIDDAGSEDLLEYVWKKQIDCTVADSNIVAINRRYYPELKVMFDLTETEHFVWLLRPNAEKLEQKLQSWFVQFKDRGQLTQSIEKYYGFVNLFDYVDTRKYVTRIEKRFPKYRAMFQQAADQYKLDMFLLAAQAYQESHWRPKAKSPTGVRGIMMLTLPTAKQMGVTSRLNPQQSINGGAKYLSQLKDRINENVEEPDRTWYALAAYNLGIGHLRDARTLAEQQGKNPNSWLELKTVLPLLSQKTHYQHLPYGYARGHEAVRYVQRIRDYKHILENQLSGTGVHAETAQKLTNNLQQSNITERPKTKSSQ